MCGIVGVAITAVNGFFQKEMDVFESLLYMDTLRGDDSTGVGLLNNDGSATVIKEAIPGYWFLTSGEFGDLSKEAIKHGKCLIGHNRKKTVGAVSDATAHPFVIDERFVFVHNGTLQNHKQLFDTEVDSEALGMLITRCEGDKTKLEEALAKVQGAYACAWFDKQKMKLYLLRNKERPLCMGKTTQGWHFASEFGMLFAATAREGLKLEDSDVVPEHTLIEFDLTKGHNMSFTKTELTIPKKAITTAPVARRRGSLVLTATTNSSPTTQTRKTTHTTAVNGGEGVSKNAFKRFRATCKKGTRISFWLDDNLPVTGDVDGSRFVYFGQDTNLEIKHIVKGMWKGAKKDLDDHEGGLCTGVVYDLEYSKDHKFVEILVNNLEFKNYGKHKNQATVH